MIQTCLWPERDRVSGRFCRSIAYWWRGTYLCPHHIGAAMDRGGVPEVTR